jgi:AAA15 family ATPase/GTPase
MKAQKNKENSDLLINYGKNGKYLKVVSVYGGNSSGKSNLLSIFSFLKYNILGYREKSKDDDEFEELEETALDNSDTDDTEDTEEDTESENNED